MSNLTVKQRKLIYACVALILLGPIVVLGTPPTRNTPGREAGFQSYLARSRAKYDLGEASLGDVDPTSSTMNLVLLGMRGIAASVLWNQAEYYKERKNFELLDQTVRSIILLQPHFKAVWEYQAWNLAFNVSSECDRIEDRYFWVKRGAKFLEEGIQRNQFVPELKWEMGRFLSQRLGHADEKEFFRRYFLHDPDERFKGEPDEAINPDHKDNFLVARDWFQAANDTLEHKGVTQHRMELALFVAYPYRSLMEYARARQKDGLARYLEENSPMAASLTLGSETSALDLMEADEREQAYKEWAETVRLAWSQAFDEWTNKYGRMRIQTSGLGQIVLEDDESGLDTLRQIAEDEGVSFQEKKRAQDGYRNVTKYTYWKRHCDIEKREVMTRARYLLAEGRRLYRAVQDFESAKDHLHRGMTDLDDVIDEYQVDDTTNLVIDDEEGIVEEGLKALLIWRQIHELLGETIPDTYPLQRLWEDPKLDQQREELTDQFRRWQGNL